MSQKQPSGGHFERPISTELHPYGISLYLEQHSQQICKQ
jgi:hypothetical protein